MRAVTIRVDGDAGRFIFQIFGCAGTIHATGLLYLDAYWANPNDLHSRLFGATVFGSFLGHFASEIIMSENTLGEAMRCFVVRWVPCHLYVCSWLTRGVGDQIVA